MAQYDWSTCPQTTRTQIENFAHAVREILHTTPNNLTGIYLHGSLAAGCFNPTRSDLDLLVVTTRRGVSLEEKWVLANYLLQYSGQPSNIEVSFLSESQLIPWRYPTPFSFHYSEAWRERMTDDLKTGAWQTWNDVERTDPDLAAHITFTRARGVTLFGDPIADVFPIVPAADYRDSIVGDWDWIHDHIPENPVYGILNACRVYAFLCDNIITSKQEGGEWARSRLPEPHRALVETALKAYRSELSVDFDEQTLRQFTDEMAARIGVFRP